MSWGIKVPTVDGLIDITASFRSLRTVSTYANVTSIFTVIDPPAPYAETNSIAFATSNDGGVPPACGLIGGSGSSRVYMHDVAPSGTASTNWDVHIASFGL